MQLNVLVYGAFLYASGAAPKKPQLAIPPEATVLDPATEEQVLARNVKASFTGPKCLECNLDSAYRFSIHFSGPGRAQHLASNFAYDVDYSGAWLDEAR